MSAVSSQTEDDVPLSAGSYPPPVYPSAHLRDERWPARADPDEDILVAWRRARPLDVRYAEDGRERVPEHDEGRYDPWTESVLFRRGDQLTTCYSVELQDITNDHGEAVREAVREQFWRSGGGFVSRHKIDITNTEATHE